MRNFVLLFFAFLPLLFAVTGCSTVSKQTPPEKEDTITLLFAGDVMAHKPNFNMRGYNKIWESISGTVQSADLAFANIEAPVSKDLPYSSFPNFNMHPEYPEAAVSAGFNVFSLVNNHTNDQGLEGMRATAKWAETVHTQTQNAENGRTVYFSGLKKSPEEKFSSCIIEKDGWTILFLAVTEILNRPDFKTYMNYVPYTQKGRESLTAFVSALRKENPCDIFVLSVHTDETEYVPGVAEKRRNYYYTLLESGVDVIWANHPHIIREREIIGNERTGNLEKLIMYGNGNTISGQRWQPELDNPLNDRENTGDGLLFEVTFSRKHGTESEKNVIIKETNPCYITTYINTNWEFIIKNLDSDFVDYLKNAGRHKWASYIEKRIEICGKTKETIVWK